MPIVDRQIAKQQYKLLGEGIEGEVFLDKRNPPRAIKYTNAELDKEVLDNVRLAGEIGFAPKLFEVSQENKAFAMEFLQGYDVGIHPESLGFGDDTTPYDRAFLRTLKLAHDNNIKVGDLHEDNVMVNPQTKEIKFIDQGYLSQGDKAAIVQQLFDRYSSRPLAAETIIRIIAQSSAKTKKEFKSLQKEWDNQDSKPLRLADYDRIINHVYALLDLDRENE